MRTSSYLIAGAVGLAMLAAGFIGDAAGEEAPQQPRVLSERCEAWLAWLVDGNLTPWMRVPTPALNHIARDCLGREANPLKRSPVPPPPEAEVPKINI